MLQYNKPLHLKEAPGFRTTDFGRLGFTSRTTSRKVGDAYSRYAETERRLTWAVFYR